MSIPTSEDHADIATTPPLPLSTKDAKNWAMLSDALGRKVSPEGLSPDRAQAHLVAVLKLAAITKPTALLFQGMSSQMGRYEMSQEKGVPVRVPASPRGAEFEYLMSIDKSRKELEAGMTASILENLSKENLDKEAHDHILHRGVSTYVELMSYAVLRDNRCKTVLNEIAERRAAEAASLQGNPQGLSQELYEKSESANLSKELSRSLSQPVFAQEEPAVEVKKLEGPAPLGAF